RDPPRSPFRAAARACPPAPQCASCPCTLDHEEHAVPAIQWTESDTERSVGWRSESGARPPRRVITADDRMNADTAHKLACEGTALLWRGDYRTARRAPGATRPRIARQPRPR